MIITIIIVFSHEWLPGCRKLPSLSSCLQTAPSVAPAWPGVALRQTKLSDSQGWAPSPWGHRKGRGRPWGAWRPSSGFGDSLGLVGAKGGWDRVAMTSLVLSRSYTWRPVAS